MKKIMKIFVLLVFAITYTLPISAKLYMGKLTLQVGETREVEAVPPTSAYTASGSFSKTGTCIAITANGSYTCKIRANYVGKGTLSYWGAVARSNSWTTETYDMYWDVEVKAKSNDGGGSSSGSSSGDGIYEEDRIEEPTDDWSKSGNYAISWYNKNKTDFTISSNKELAGMAYLVNNGYTEFKDCTIKLTDDIDLSGKKWISCKTFKGVFDGQGHSINGIFIGTESDDQQYFGFWRTLSGATIQNVNIEGVTKYDVKLYETVNVSAGGIAGKAESGIVIQNCRVNMDISFRRGKVNSLGSVTIYTNQENYFSYVGGICGWLEGGKILNCINMGSIKCYSREGSWPSQGLCLGGIAGYCEYSGIIEYCENLSPLLKVVDGYTDDYGYLMKSISGIVTGISPRFCRSIIDVVSVEVEHGTRYAYVFGISNGSPTNCYSVISRYNARSNYTNTRTHFYYGGISGSSAPLASFSNNDILLYSDWSGRSFERGNDGSTSFSSVQMQTPAFLEELNMYSLLETDEDPLWTQDSNGGYPYVAELYQKASGIEDVVVDGIEENVPIYNLSGQRLTAPKKGINIIGGKKVIVK